MPFSGEGTGAESDWRSLTMSFLATGAGTDGLRRSVWKAAACPTQDPHSLRQSRLSSLTLSNPGTEHGLWHAAAYVALVLSRDPPPPLVALTEGQRPAGSASLGRFLGSTEAVGVPVPISSELQNRLCEGRLGVAQDPTSVLQLLPDARDTCFQEQRSKGAFVASASHPVGEETVGGRGESWRGRAVPGAPALVSLGMDGAGG